MTTTVEQPALVRPAVGRPPAVWPAARPAARTVPGPAGDAPARTTEARPSADEVRRRELSAFLRSRRERVSPERHGLPLGGRRRTPGLRREEVAQLAAVGVTWYTWLEQGRDIHASEQVLDAIARTLFLDPHERAHLFTLAGSPSAQSLVESDCVPSGVRVLIDQVLPFPAAVINARDDVLAWNSAYLRLIGDLEALPFDERNMLWLLFTSPVAQSRLVDWHAVARRKVAQYRAAMADHVAEPTWKCLVHRLESTSPEFARLWSCHEVAAPENLTKHFVHRHLGVLRLGFTNLWIDQRLGTRMIVYTPADDDTAALLPRLAEWEPEPLMP